MSSVIMITSFKVTHCPSGKPKDPRSPSPSTKNNTAVKEGEAVIQLQFISL